jgi:hypothetical protein
MVHIDLSWVNEDPSCIDAPALSATVERTLGRPVFHGDAPPSARIVGSAGPSGAGAYAAQVTLLGKDGGKLAERSLTTEGSCDRLDESIAVVISLMVDSVEDVPTPLLVPPTPPREPAGVRPIESAHPQKALPQSPPLRASLGLGAGVSHDLLPGTEAYFALRGEIELPSLPPASVSVRQLASADAVAGGAGGRFDAWSGDISVCPTLARGAVRLSLCLGAGGGVITGSPLGLLGAHSSDRGILYAVATPAAAVRVTGPLWVRAEAGVPVLFLRDPWGFLDGAGRYVEVYRPGIVAPFASLIVELRPGS